MKFVLKNMGVTGALGVIVSASLVTVVQSIKIMQLHCTYLL